jgi:hypothetical protein
MPPIRQKAPRVGESLWRTIMVEMVSRVECFSEFTVNRSILTPYNSTEGAAWKNYRTWSPRIPPSTR